MVPRNGPHPPFLGRTWLRDRSEGADPREDLADLLTRRVGGRTGPKEGYGSAVEASAR